MGWGAYQCQLPRGTWHFLSTFPTRRHGTTGFRHLRQTDSADPKPSLDHLRSRVALELRIMAKELLLKQLKEPSFM